MSNDPRENLHGSDSQELADVTADAARAGAERAASTPTHTSDEAPAPRSALSSFEEILSGASHEADAPTADETTETLADDGSQDLQETLVSPTPLVTTDEAEAAPAALATDAAAAAENTAQTASDVAPETATPQAAPQQPSQELTPANRAATNTNNAVAAPVHLPPAAPRPWYRSRRSFSAKGRGGRVQVAGLGLTYTDHVTGAVLLANIDLGFRARSLSAILDPTGRRARALFLILAGLEEPQAGRIVAAPSRSLAARLAGRIGSVALIRADSPLDESLTIRQNILAPLSATGSVADWDNLVGALQITGLAQRVDLRPSELSEWERFKALIARAIVSGAEVFLVEDPVTLPAAAREELGPLLRSLADAGCAVVIATPNAEVAAASDRAILLTNGRVALDAPNPSAAIIAASLEANPEDPKALLGPIPSALPASFDEVISPTGSSSAPAWHPLGTADEAGAQTSDTQQAPEPEEAAEAALDAATTRVEAAPAHATQATEVPQASPEPRTETAMRGIPVVEAEDPALAEPEVSDLVVRARKILSDLPGSIAPQE
ncbi:ATP-binding cassette domain-containing protein [Schaalia odontolytica]|uniref:ATP-binding cassette domain-containing protein n=1 Tax=Schaalia odontolytica TaxID=1660 RepID=UPI00210CD150|nr:ATP-binding cassette domain-containing protein [Schaalia odontolytica]MCQ5272554.1 ATP-binding cassette domain-containing protein [Schaalia odontolytica]MCQ5282358.1 ATP-binding cassette domain-containing protein [Schaalia odontolytica]